MTYVIAEPCVGTKGAICVAVCPIDGIHPTPEEAAFQFEEMLYINPASCIDCGLCADECPVEAVFPEEDLPEKWKSYAQRNANYYIRH